MTVQLSLTNSPTLKVPNFAYVYPKIHGRQITRSLQVWCLLNRGWSFFWEGERPPREPRALYVWLADRFGYSPQAARRWVKRGEGIFFRYRRGRGVETLSEQELWEGVKDVSEVSPQVPQWKDKHGRTRTSEIDYLTHIPVPEEVVMGSTAEFTAFIDMPGLTLNNGGKMWAGLSAQKLGVTQATVYARRKILKQVLVEDEPLLVSRPQVTSRLYRGGPLGAGEFISGDGWAKRRTSSVIEITDPRGGEHTGLVRFPVNKRVVKEFRPRRNFASITDYETAANDPKRPVAPPEQALIRAVFPTKKGGTAGWVTVADYRFMSGLLEGINAERTPDQHRIDVAEAVLRWPDHLYNTNFYSNSILSLYKEVNTYINNKEVQPLVKGPPNG